MYICIHVYTLALLSLLPVHVSFCRHTHRSTLTHLQIPCLTEIYDSVHVSIHTSTDSVSIASVDTCTDSHLQIPSACGIYV